MPGTWQNEVAAQHTWRWVTTGSSGTILTSKVRQQKAMQKQTANKQGHIFAYQSSIMGAKIVELTPLR